MPEPSPWMLVVNPAAGRGRGKRLVARLERALEREAIDARIVISEHPGHAEQLAQEGAQRGIVRFAAVGGDGTAHEVANGLAAYARERGDDARLRSLNAFTLAVVAIGTGNDWARSLGGPLPIEAAIARLARARSQPCDLGRVFYRGAKGPQSRIFVNVAGAGFDGFVIERLGERKPGAWAYLIELLRSHRSFVAPELGVTVEHEHATSAQAPAISEPGGTPGLATARRSLAVFACLGSHCGGGMRMAPDARIDDGLIDVTQIDAMSGAQLLWELRRLFDGSLRHSRHVRMLTTRALEVASAPHSAVEADGELLGTTPARIEVLPGAIRVIRD
ncbi:MAG: diacylglycerol kinase family lipid kinase [Burkholderiaceae bacterium]|nr:diacylglycerol kinase family lipid kinase [Burkholderiaceae bacterium]